MDRTVASVLWFALCVGMEGVESTGAARSAPPRSSDAGARSLLRDYTELLYRSLSILQPGHGNGSSGSANTVTAFIDKGTDLPSWESGQRYVFDLSSLSRVDPLVQAELRILRKPFVDLPTDIPPGGNFYNVRLYSCSAEGASETQLLDSRTVEVLDGSLPRWEVFDVWSSIKARPNDPAESPQACFNLVVSSELTNQVADPLLLGLSRHGRPQQHKALLVVHTRADTRDSLFTEVMEKMKKEGRGFRVPNAFKSIPKHKKKHQRQGRRALYKRSFSGTGRRAAAEGKGGRRRARCSRKPLRVNFKDLGWDDWIIAPLDYEAHYCDGVCDFPLRSHLEPTNHAVIQTLMNSMDPGTSPPSCCVPSKLSPISILYIDSSNNVIYKQYEDMVVESCGCR